MSQPGGAGPRVCLIGGLRVEHGDASYHGAQLGSRKGRTVLALLAASPGRMISPDTMAEALWPRQRPDSADATIASLISRLRRTLGADVITGGRAGYRLAAPPAADVDLAAAARLTAEAERRCRGGQPALALAAAQAAVTILDSGQILDDAQAADGEPLWLSTARSDQAALLRRARHTAAEAALAAGDHRSAQQAAAAAVAVDQLDEEAVRALIAARVAAGDAGAALAAYEGLRRALAEQLGADPAPATQRLYASVLHGEDEPHGPRTQPAARPALLGLAGREAELEQLTQLWTAGVAGSGALVLLGGEPGAGKTRLAEELVRVVRDTGGAVLTARCYEAERGLFLQPFVEAISAAAATLPPSTIRMAATEHLDSLARLVPEVRAAVGEPASTRGRSDVERRRSIEAVAAFVCALAVKSPLLLVLDDLHNAGESTIELLHFLRTRLPSAPLLVLATVRTVEGASVLAALAPVAARLDVGPLRPAAVQALATAAGQGQRGAEISRRTGGHALFTVEILRGLGSDTELPESLQAAVLSRVDGLGAAAEAVLRAGAVLGSAFDPQLAAALAGIARPDALRHCEQAMAAGLLVTAGRNYEFANDVLREVMYATTAEPTRLALHAQAIDLLHDSPEQVAEHAAAIGEWQRAARAWLLAAERAMDHFAAAESVALASRALAAAGHSAGDGMSELKARALVARGRAAYAMTSFQQAWDDLGAAIAAAREAGDRRTEMIALRERAHDVHVSLGRPPAESEQPLRECLRLADSLGDRAMEASVLNRLAVLSTNRLDFVTAIELGERALRLARASGQRQALIYGLDAVKTAHAYLGETTRLAEIVGELEPLERADGDLMMLQWSVFESFVVPLAAGDVAGAGARIEAALALNRRSGYTAFEPFFVAHLGWVRRLDGDLLAAEQIGARAVAAGRERPHAWWLATAASMYAVTLTELGRAADAAREIERVLPGTEVAGAEAYRLRCLGPLAACTGSADILTAASDLLDSLVTPPGTAWLLGADAYLGIARAWSARGDAGRAAATLAPLRAAALRQPWPVLARLADEAAPTAAVSARIATHLQRRV